jgi:hypothetical protein
MTSCSWTLANSRAHAFLRESTPTSWSFGHRGARGLLPAAAGEYSLYRKHRQAILDSLVYACAAGGSAPPLSSPETRKNSRSPRAPSCGKM